MNKEKNMNKAEAKTISSSVRTYGCVTYYARTSYCRLKRLSTASSTIQGRFVAPMTSTRAPRVLSMPSHSCMSSVLACSVASCSCACPRFPSIASTSSVQQPPTTYTAFCCSQGIQKQRATPVTIISFELNSLPMATQTPVQMCILHKVHLSPQQYN